MTFAEIDAYVVARALVLDDNVPPAERLLAANEAQRELARRYALSWLGTVGTIALTAGVGSASLPSDWARGILVWYIGSDGATHFLEYLDVSAFTSSYPQGTDADVPAAYTIFGDTLEVGPPPANDMTLYARYIAYPPELTATAPGDENIVTRKAWDYLIAAMTAAAFAYQFEEAEPRAQLWRQRAHEIAQQLEVEDCHGRAMQRTAESAVPGRRW